MARFYRVMRESEWRLVEAHQRIAPSENDWVVYAPGAVVFLFCENTEPRRFTEYCEELKSKSDEPVLLVSFDALPSFMTSPDRSGWDSIGGVVHEGAVVVADTVDGFKVLWKR